MAIVADFFCSESVQAELDRQEKRRAQERMLLAAIAPDLPKREGETAEVSALRARLVECEIRIAELELENKLLRESRGRGE